MNKYIFILFIILIITACDNKIQGDLHFVEASQENGFNYPYFLFIPDNILNEEELFIIIEPNNSGFADDDFKNHIDKAERIATKTFYLGNYVAQALKCPLLVPVFPRTANNWKIYTHALDRDVMKQKNNSLERIDLQLLEMFYDAKSKLKDYGFTTEDQFLMTGFSASGTFVNRFTLLHPDKVFAAAAGGLNGLLSLPKDSIGTKALDYPLGTNDFKKSFNLEFQKSAFLNTPQFYFMGENDENDAIPYEDAFDSDERTLIYEILGEKMLPIRWEKCKEIYRMEEVNARIKTFSTIGHENTEYVKQEIVEFFQMYIN